MDDIAFLVEIQAFVARHSNGFPCSVIFLEEFDRITSRHYPGTLIFQQELRRAFQDGGVEAMRFESYAGEESA